MKHEKHSGYGRIVDLDDLVPALQDTPAFKAHAAGEVILNKRLEPVLAQKGLFDR